MANPPSGLQARIKRLFLNHEIETQFQQELEGMQPYLNAKEKPTSGVSKNIAIQTNYRE